MKKKFIAMSLAVLMIICLLPLNVFAEEGISDEQLNVQNFNISNENSSTGVPTSTPTMEEVRNFLEQSSADYEKSMSATNTGDLASDMITALLDGALTSISGKAGKVIGEWASDQFMSLVFGIDEKSTTEKTLEAIQQMNKKQNETIALLNEVKSMLTTASMLDPLNQMMQISSGAGTNSLFNETQVAMNTLAKYEDTKNYTEAQIEYGRKSALIYGIAGTDVSKYDMVTGYDNEVYSLGQSLLFSYELQGGETSSALDLMNRYDLQINKWEHQGYVKRESYWNGLLNLYVSSAAIMKASLQARMDVFKETTGNTAENLESQLKYLNEQIPKVQALAESTKVERLDDSIRHYQVPGHEAYMYTTTVKQDISKLLKNATRNKKTDNYTSSSEDSVNDYWIPMYTVQSGELAGKIALPAEVYQNIYDDYNPAGTPDSKKVSLNDIFFGKNNGNLTAPSGIDNNALFLSSSVWTKTNRIKQIGSSTWTQFVGCALFEGTDASHPAWRSSEMKSSLIGDIHTLISYYKYSPAGKATSSEKVNIPSSYSNRLVMVVALDYEQSAGSQAHEASDEILYDDDYHWNECVEGDAVNIKEHTLVYKFYSSSHWQACEECGYTGEKSTHEFGKWTVTKQASKNAKGLKERVCSVCQYTETAEIAATKSDVPKTGDETNAVIWIIIMAAACGFTAVYRKFQKQ